MSELWKVGDTGVFVPQQWGRLSPKPRNITITKVARKWVYFGPDHLGERFDPATGSVDGRGYSSPGIVWRSEAEWRERTTVETLYAELRRRMGAPDRGVSVADVQQAALLLRISLPTP